MKNLLKCSSFIRVAIIIVVMAFMAGQVTETFAGGYNKKCEQRGHKWNKKGKCLRCSISKIVKIIMDKDFDSDCNDNDWIIFGTDMYSGVSGNVGIGTMSPATKLHVHGSSNPVMQLSNDDSRLQFGIASGNGAFSNFAKNGAFWNFSIL